MLDEKLERKAEEQATAMAQVARQMAARGAPVPLLPETVFHKQAALPHRAAPTPRGTPTPAQLHASGELRACCAVSK